MKLMGRKCYPNARLKISQFTVVKVFVPCLIKLKFQLFDTSNYFLTFYVRKFEQKWVREMKHNDF